MGCAAGERSRREAGCAETGARSPEPGLGIRSRFRLEVAASRKASGPLHRRRCRRRPNANHPVAGIVFTPGLPPGRGRHRRASAIEAALRPAAGLAQSETAQLGRHSFTAIS
jgi:hypothetical protein